MFSAPLFDEKKRYMWMYVSLSAAIGASLPSLVSLDVLYPGRTLMENLPSIYQRDDSANGFIRSLVGVLETTTQGIDKTIGSMGALISPSMGSESWLDFVARWLGVPWDDELSSQQKRNILNRAGEIAASRGTRRGIETLLECLIPGEPRRFRVTDAVADRGFTVIGGPSSRGTELPAILGGRKRANGELDFGAVLGSVRLHCEGEADDGVSHLAGTVQVEVAATARERKAWEPWLRALITEMIPLTSRVRLDWVAEHSLRSNTLDGSMMLDEVPIAHLGIDAITDLARLPDRSIRLASGEPIIGRRLR